MRPTEKPIPPPTRTTEEWEQVRRSVAMLPTDSWALKREQALEALTYVITSTRAAENQAR